MKAWERSPQGHRAWALTRSKTQIYYIFTAPNKKERSNFISKFRPHSRPRFRGISPFLLSGGAGGVVHSIFLSCTWTFSFKFRRSRIYCLFSQVQSWQFPQISQPQWDMGTRRRKEHPGWFLRFIIPPQTSTCRANISSNKLVFSFTWYQVVPIPKQFPTPLSSAARKDIKKDLTWIQKGILDQINITNVPTVYSSTLDTSFIALIYTTLLLK